MAEAALLAVGIDALAGGMVSADGGDVERSSAHPRDDALAGRRQAPQHSPSSCVCRRALAMLLQSWLPQRSSPRLLLMVYHKCHKKEEWSKKEAEFFSAKAHATSSCPDCSRRHLGK